MTIVIIRVPRWSRNRDIAVYGVCYKSIGHGGSVMVNSYFYQKSYTVNRFIVSIDSSSPTLYCLMSSLLKGRSTGKLHFLNFPLVKWCVSGVRMSFYEWWQGVDWLYWGEMPVWVLALALYILSLSPLVPIWRYLKAGFPLSFECSNHCEGQQGIWWKWLWGRK